MSTQDNLFHKIFFTSIGNSIATTIVHPMEVKKIQKQLSKKNGNTPPVYAGYLAALIRQMTYSIPNLVIFSSLQSHYRYKYKEEPSIMSKVLFGTFSGGIASLTGNPAELMMGRTIKNTITQKDNKSYNQRLNSLYIKNGLSTFWKGAIPNVLRGAFYNATRLPVYSTFKQQLEKKYPHLKGTIYLHFSGALVASTFGTLVTSPIDVVKARVQTSNKTVTECVSQMINKEGYRSFYKGAAYNIMKSAPHSVISFVIVDQLSSYFMGKEIL